MRLISAALLCCLALPAHAFDGVNGVVSLGYTNREGTKWDGAEVLGSASVKQGPYVGQLDFGLSSFAGAGTSTSLGLHFGAEVAPGALVGLFAYTNSEDGTTERGYGIEAAYHTAGLVVSGQVAKFGSSGSLSDRYVSLGVEGRLAPRLSGGLALERHSYVVDGQFTTVTAKLGYDVTETLRVTGFVSQRNGTVKEKPTFGLMLEARLGDGPAFDSLFDW